MGTITQEKPLMTLMLSMSRPRCTPTTPVLAGNKFHIRRHTLPRKHGFDGFFAVFLTRAFWDSFDPNFPMMAGMRFPPPLPGPMLSPEEGIEVDEHGNVNWRMAWLKEIGHLQQITAEQEKAGVDPEWYRMMLFRVRGALMPPPMNPEAVMHGIPPPPHPHAMQPPQPNPGDVQQQQQ